jgi:divalent metal cation (Fe/Co/Zn/Cd) transporter
MKTRPVLVIIVTLILGFILGMLTSAQIRFHRLKPMRMYVSDDRFREGFYKIIQPDEKQKAKIEQILDKYSSINGNLQNNFRKELNSNVEQMRKELDANLTREQIARLKEMDDRRQEMMRQAIRNHRQDSTGVHRRMRPGWRHEKDSGDYNRPEIPPPAPPDHF